MKNLFTRLRENKMLLLITSAAFIISTVYLILAYYDTIPLDTNEPIKQEAPATQLKTEQPKPQPTKKYRDSALDTATKPDTADWKIYKHDTLGISFRYPAEWGEPVTEPSAAITDLSTINKPYMNNCAQTYCDNINAYTVRIYFKNKNRENATTPYINIYNDKYSGEFYPNLDAHGYGPADNFNKLRATGNICDYAINFKPFGWNGSLEETYSSCDQGIKTSFVRNLSGVSEKSPDGQYQFRHSYEMNFYAFKHLQNGYFDNALIVKNIDRISQQKATTTEGLITLSFEGFLNNPNKARQLLSAQTIEDYRREKGELQSFAESIRTFAPPAAQPKQFQDIPNENPDITVIRRYYFELENGRLAEAYAMYRDKKVSFDQFKEWYQNIISAAPQDIKKTGDNQYSFTANVQEKNQKLEIYRVVMEVSGGRINTLSSEKLTTDKVTYQNYTAFVMERRGKNYMILSDGKNEKIIEEAEAEFNWEKENNNVGNVLIFRNIEFSPMGNYLTYIAYGWEWSIGRVYDIRNDKIVLEPGSPYIRQFTPDEKNYISCANNHFMGEVHATIYNVPDFTTKYDLLQHHSNREFFDISCEYDSAQNKVLFNMRSLDETKVKKIEYDISAGQEKLFQ